MLRVISVDGEFEFDQFLLAEEDRQPVGTLRLNIQPDGTGMLWPPTLLDDLSSNSDTGWSFQRRIVVEDALLQAAARRLDAEQAWIGQALLEADQPQSRVALERNGFPMLTELRFLSLDLRGELPPNCEKPTRTFLPYRRSRHRLRFANLLEQTYRGTLDCPELNGLRDAEKSLQSHEFAGRFTQEMWRLYRLHNGDAGLLLMAQRPEQQAWEVLYMGVAERARQQGLGKAMLLDGMHAARDAGVERMLLVVDARNYPATQLYESLGFAEVSRRIAHVRLRQSGHQHVLHSDKMR